MRNTITSLFLKEQIEDPLFIQAYRPQEVFKISFKRNEDCHLHTEYIKFLKRKEAERHEAQLKRRQELQRRQEEHQFHIRLVRERDRLLALQLKKQQQLQTQLKNLNDQYEKIKRQQEDQKRKLEERTKAEAQRLLQKKLNEEEAAARKLKQAQQAQELRQ